MSVGAGTQLGHGQVTYSIGMMDTHASTCVRPPHPPTLLGATLLNPSAEILRRDCIILPPPSILTGLLALLSLSPEMLMQKTFSLSLFFLYMDACDLNVCVFFVFFQTTTKMYCHNQGVYYTTSYMQLIKR